MFVMTNDGGLPEDHVQDLTPECILNQRVFLFDLLHRGLAVTILQNCEFRDAKVRCTVQYLFQSLLTRIWKVSSFVYEQRLDRLAKQLFPEHFWESVTLSRSKLDAELRRQQLSTQPQRLVPGTDKNACLLALSRFLLSAMPSSHISFGLLYLFILHCCLLDEISVHERARPLATLHPQLTRMVVYDFLPKIFLAMDCVISSSHVFLDVDGRIFSSLIRYFTCNPTLPINDIVGQSVYSRTSSIWSNLGTPQPDFRGFATRFPPPPSPAVALTSEVEPLRILPFENEVFNLELSSIQITVELDIQTSPAHLEFGQGILFSDTQHWHNRNRAIINVRGKDPKPTDEWQRRRVLKGEQRFMATLQRQAGTLTGALGASLQRIVILPAATKVSQYSVQLPILNFFFGKAREAPKKARKQGKETSAEKLRKDILAKKQSKNEDSSLLWWQDQLKLMAKMTHGEKFHHLDALNRNKKSQERPLDVEIRLYRIHLLLSRWIDEQDGESASVRDQYTLSIMRTVKEIYDRGSPNPTIATILSSVLVCLGFDGYASLLNHSSGEDVTDRPLSFKFLKLIKSKTKSPVHSFMHITENPVVWQLRLFGEFMDRSMDSQPDIRVAFEPDAWQREVLDCIDRNTSMLVVAPTSAGKTFISYYAMEKVLRESDDGILVYVAPTKALVGQIAAEVYARFSKDLKGS